MNFLIYSGYMEADIKSLEAKVTKLITLCNSLREENALLLGDLTQAQQTADTLKNNMQQASNKLEVLLESMPQNVEVA
jgi:cell division protein ZapB